MLNTQNLKIIVKALTGSHLFGLSTPKSDMDYKGVFQASLDDIILETAPKNINFTTNKSDSRNTSEDVDTELKELRTFIKDCIKGRTYALELLYIPQNKILESSPTWEFIQINREKLQSNDLSPFIGYAFTQSQKYSLRGVRLQELERVITWFEMQNRNSKLKDCLCTLKQTKYTYTQIYKHINNLELPDEQRLSCLGMILQTDKYIKECLPTLIKRLNQYGDRSKQNKADGGIDWKAYSHAFRLIYEWEQLLLEGKLTFPVPNCNYILAVKLGQISFEEVQEKLYEEFERIQKIPNNLPRPDLEFWNNWILSLYHKTLIRKA